MSRIVAIGGGEIGLWETIDIDRYIISLAGMEHPRMLFIPTASFDTQSYIDVVFDVYGQNGCECRALCLDRCFIRENDIADMILNTDIIYVGGGDTEHMMQKWKECRVDEFLLEANRRNIILSGLSAGSDCWFHAGYTDSEFLQNIPNPQFKWIHGLGILPYVHTPHYNHPERQGFDESITSQTMVAIALVDNVALVSIDGQLSVINTNENHHGYYFHNDGHQFHKYQMDR